MRKLRRNRLRGHKAGGRYMNNMSLDSLGCHWNDLTYMVEDLSALGRNHVITIWVLPAPVFRSLVMKGRSERNKAFQNRKRWDITHKVQLHRTAHQSCRHARIQLPAGVSQPFTTHDSKNNARVKSQIHNIIISHFQV